MRSVLPRGNISFDTPRKHNIRYLKFRICQEETYRLVFAQVLTNFPDITRGNILCSICQEATYILFAFFFYDRK